MKILKLRNKVARLYKCTSFVVLIGCTVPVLAQNSIGEKEHIIANDSLMGSVFDALTKKALAGVKVQSVDQHYSAMTNEQGEFKIKIPSHIHTLVVLAPEYDKKEIIIFKGDKNKRIEISPSVFKNYFADVSTPFGLKRKTAVTTALSSFELNNLSSISADEEIKKNMAGQLFTATRSGTPASGTYMLIRGVNSLNSNNTPLIIVDGVIFDNFENKASIHLGSVFNPLSCIDVNDIQSISVLKDGTSLYGSKGGNGVILINTNRGKSMVTKITVSGMIGYNQKPQTVPMMNSDEYRIYLSDLIQNNDARKSIANDYFLNI
ncbi:MAG: TonB-dependent receptor plug domain-containing protein [Paludibacteraceae bacterium]